MNGTIRLAKKCGSFVIYVSNFFTSNCLNYSPHDVLVVYPTSHQRSLEHIAQQPMLVQNLTLQVRIQSPPNHNVYSCKCKKTQVLIHPVHCITGHARLMLHRHDLYLNWHVFFIYFLLSKTFLS